MQKLLTKFNEYKNSKNNIHFEIESLKEQFKSTEGIELNEIQSLSCADQYAEGIGATRNKDIYTLSTGQRIRYFKFIQSISFDFFLENKWQKVSISKNSQLFIKTTIEINDILGAYKLNKELNIQIKTLKRKNDILQNRINSLSSSIKTMIEEDFIEKLFPSIEEYIQVYDNMDSNRFKIVEQKDLIIDLLKASYCDFKEGSYRVNKTSWGEENQYFFDTGSKKNIYPFSEFIVLLYNISNNIKLNRSLFLQNKNVFISYVFNNLID